ncbi:MAG: sulfurtransferase-like selenium metabolism protein YedF [Nitrospirae bacterium]|nr:MAG: sulfurtransferase-like selenium metabolism protein YedF [Nitrospirota bacterium]
MEVDARGLVCPKPVVMAEEALKQIDEGTVEVLVDNEASVKNLQKFASRQGMHSEVVTEDGHWRVKITKGYTCEVQDEETTQRGIFMVIGTDTLGKEEDIGRVLMNAFLETIMVTKQLPDVMFFLNAGVKLTTVNEETVEILKQLNEMGVEIYSCGTCLKHYGLEDELKVGYRGTTNHIVEALTDFQKVVWI